MKKLLLVIQFVAFALACSAQAPNWIWAETQTSGTCNMDTKGLWAGPSGDVYVGGRYGGTLSINGATTSTGGTEIFTGKMDTAGHFLWLDTHPYGGGNDYDYGFGADVHENTYITGIIQGSNGLYVDKYDSAGIKKWNFSPGALSVNVSGYGNVSVDKSGNVFFTGGYQGSKNFGPVTLNPIGSNDYYLAKLDSNGNCKWAVSAGAPGQEVNGRGTAVDADGNIYACGSYNGTATFYSTGAGSITLPTVSGNDCFFIAKYDTGGNVLWVTTASNAGFNSGAPYWQYDAIITDSCSNIYVTGHYVNAAQFGPFTLANSNSNYNIFVAKCNPNGNWEWAKGAGGNGNDEAWGLVLDKHSDVYISGYFSTSATFDNQTVTGNASATAFVAKYTNSTGDLQWVQTPTGGTDFTYAVGLAIDKKGYCYVTGSIGTGSNATFGSSVINGPGGCSIFFAKLDTVPVRTIVPLVNQNYCPGETTTLPYTVTGTFNTGNVFTAELSDSSGSFVTDSVIGQITSTTSGTINITIPPTTPPGTYLIRVVSDSPHTSSWANGCGAYYLQNVYPNNFYITIGGGSSLSILASADTICSGGSVTLVGKGGSSYQWSTGATTDTIIVKPSADTTYFLTSSGACAGSDSIKLTVNAVSALTLQPQSPTVCNGVSVTLIADTTGNNYSWSPAAGLSVTTGDSVLASPTVTTIYTVTGTSALGCALTGTDTVRFNSPAPLIIQPQGGVSICSGQSATLTVPASGSDYVWSPATGLNVTTGDNVIASPTVSITYTVTGLDSLGCTVTNTEPVNVGQGPNQPTIILSTTGDTLFSSAKNGNQWYVNGRPISGSTDSTFVIAGLPNGDTITVEVTNVANGCSTTSNPFVTGINPFAISNNQISIYPNPTNGAININICSSAIGIKDWSLKLFDVFGRTLYTQASLNYKNEIDLSNLAGGVYFISIINASSRAVFPVIKQN